MQTLWGADGLPGHIYRLTLDGQVMGMLGGSGKTLGRFGWVHEVARHRTARFGSERS